MFVDVCAWLTREDYAAHRALDPNGLPATFDEWLRNAERGVEDVKRKGIFLHRVAIDPDELAAWCRANHRVVNGRARSQFAVVVYQRSHDNSRTA